MKEHSNYFFATGVPSIFLIFAVLLLVILSLLGYGTSRQDLVSSTNALEQTTAYYQACCEASVFCADTETDLKKLQQEVPSPELYFQQAETYFSNLEHTVWDSETHILQYVQAFSKTQSLQVQLLVSPPSEGNSSPLQLLTWNTILTSHWEPDTRQSVYKGDF